MNWATNRFLEGSPERARWVAENEYKFRGLMRIVSVFIQGAFPKQTQEFMEYIKEFAEGAE